MPRPRVRREFGPLLCYRFETTVARLLNGRQWLTPEMNKLNKEGRVRVASLGVFVVHNGNRFDVIEARAAMTWSTKTKPEANAVDKLIRDAMELTDRRMLSTVSSPADSLVVSRQFRYNRGSVNAEHEHFWVNMYTVFAVVR